MKRPLITVSGPPGSGTTTLVEKLTNTLNFESVNGGDVFRKMAEERGMTLAEFTHLAGSNEEIDREVDKRIKTIINTHTNGNRPTDGDGLVVESRLSGWHSDGRADISIWLDAPISVRADRIGDRNETVDELRTREKSEAQRYKEYYGIDISNLDVYDIVLNTETLSKSGVLNCVIEAYNDTVSEKQ